MEGTLYVTSDQKENTSAIPGETEKTLCTRVAKAAVADAVARGHKAWFLDPNKTWLLASGMIHNPAQVVFIHMNAPSTKPGQVFGVDCSHAPNWEWSNGLCAAVSKAAPLFPKGPVYNDTYIRGFCFWFYKRLRGIPPGFSRQMYPAYKGLRSTLEIGNMKCWEQAVYVRNQPDVLGRAIAGYCQPGTVVSGLPLLQHPAVGAQPGVTIKSAYYVDVAIVKELLDYPVAWVQKTLNKHYDGVHGHRKLAPLTVDGWYGPSTESRVMLFQLHHWYLGRRLRVTGITDARTWGKLRSL